MSSSCRRILNYAVMGLLLGGQAQAERGRSEYPSVAREIRQVTTINERIRELWKQYQISPSDAAADGKWCRRLYLDLLGRIPTVAELTTFLNDRSSDRRVRLVDRLLTSEAYVEEYARNWTTIWTNILMGRTGGIDDDDFSHRPGMQKYLRNCFARNERYDQLVFELISATGSTVPGAPDFNGATNFLANKLADKAVLATSTTSQVFLGVQVQCTQCHNHPFNDWKQNQFWEMNAFFRQTRVLRRFETGTRDLSHVELTEQDFAGEGHTPERAETYFEQRNGILKAAFPVFVDGTALENRSGYLSDVNRRRELARLVVETDYLPAAAVNRLWAHFLGYGFTQPVDDMGPHNPVANRELLEYLADEFRLSQFDLKQLMRWIVLSQPYALSSRITGGNASDDPELGEPPQFSHFYLRQMRPEALYESLLVAAQADKSRGSYEEQEAAKSRWLRQFNTAFGTDEGDESTTFNGSIPQALMMFNGELIRKATSIEQGSFLARVARGDQPPRKKIEYLFLAALARKPTARELKLVNRLVVARATGASGGAGHRSRPPANANVAALQDIWWAVLNSNEFIMNH